MRVPMIEADGNFVSSGSGGYFPPGWRQTGGSERLAAERDWEGALAARVYIAGSGGLLISEYGLFRINIGGPYPYIQTLAITRPRNFPSEYKKTFLRLPA